MAPANTARSAHPSAGMAPHPPVSKRDVDKGKTETRRRGDSVAQSKFLEVPSHSRLDSTRDTLRPTPRGTERERTHRESRRDSSSKAPRTEREHRERESSTTSTIKPGSVIGTDAINTAASKHAPRGSRFDRSNLPATIHEDESTGSRAPRTATSRHDTAKPGQLVPYESQAKHGQLVPHETKSKNGHLIPYDARGPSRASPSNSDRDLTRGGTSHRGGADANRGGEDAMTKRHDKSLNGLMRDQLARRGPVWVEATQIKVQTSSGTKIEFNNIAMHRCH